VKQLVIITTFILALAVNAAAQEIRVTPTSVNAYSQGATSAFLTFSNVVNKRPADACFCGELAPATPDLGFRCKPGTEFGCLPVRYDQSRLASNTNYTDIMSIPPSVARRAYLDAAGGGEATFFYVRRFISLLGGPDEFVPVTIRLAGNGAAVPFSITNVKLSWGVDKPVLLVKSDEKLPAIRTEITYTGTGRLVGRWEIVKPGEALPDDRDLLTEATLPAAERGLQRRYTELSRFNIFLPPVGKFNLPGPEGWRVPSHIEGLYVVLLRIEAATDANPAALTLPVATGGVAGFAMPVLRYYVGGGSGLGAAPIASPVDALHPADDDQVAVGESVEFNWLPVAGAVFYRLDIEDGQSQSVFSALLLAGTNQYRAPSWLGEKAAGGALRWRVAAFDTANQLVSETPKRRLRFGASR
jgi:hypothetical protein